MYKEWKSFCLLNDKLHHLVIRCPNVRLRRIFGDYFSLSIFYSPTQILIISCIYIFQNAVIDSQYNKIIYRFIVPDADCITFLF